MQAIQSNISIGNTKIQTISRCSDDVHIFNTGTIVVDRCRDSASHSDTVITSRQICVFSHRSIVIFLLPMLPCHHWDRRGDGVNGAPHVFSGSKSVFFPRIF